MPISNEDELALLTAVREHLAAREVRFEWELSSTPDGRNDGLVQLSSRGETKTRHLIVKRQLRPSTVPTVFPSLLRPEGPPVFVVTDHVTPGVGRRLRQEGLWYADGVGNAYVELPTLLLDIEGRKPDKSAPRAQSTRGLSISTSAVYLALLTDHALMRAPLRHLAALTGASLGTTQKVARAAKDQGLGDDSRAWRPWAHVWLNAQFMGLREALVLGRYSSHLDIDRIVDELPPGTAVSGEAASFAQGANIRPATLDLYAHSKSDLIRRGRLRPHPEGWITVRMALWSQSGIDELLGRSGDTLVVPPLLQYSDLVSLDDPRTARLADEVVSREPTLQSLLG